MTRTENIIKRISPIDKRCKLNRSSKPVAKSILDTIDQGITIEELDRFAAQGLPIKRYQTQVTIHGRFPEVGNGYVFGYKSIVRNGNESIGVKWIAIDEEKRKRMKPYMKIAGFSYSRNSTQQTFTRMKRTSKETFEADKAAFKALADKVDESLFIGSVEMYLANVWGQAYICLDVTISAIYEKNIRPFLDKLGATEEALAAVRQQEEQEADQRKREQEARDNEKERVKAANIAAAEADTDLLNAMFGPPRKHDKTETGTFVRQVIDHNPARYHVTHRVKKGKAKMPHVLTKTFSTAAEAIAYAKQPTPEVDHSWKRDSTSLGLTTFTGQRIK